MRCRGRRPPRSGGCRARRTPRCGRPRRGAGGGPARMRARPSPRGAPLAPAAIDRARLDLWARRVQVDAAAGRRAAVKGDVAVLEWIRDRVAHTLDAVDRTSIDTRLVRLRANVGDARFAAAARGAAELRRLLAGD